MASGIAALAAIQLTNKFGLGRSPGRGKAHAECAEVAEKTIFSASPDFGELDSTELVEVSRAAPSA